ncbi:MAG TPA: adenylate kinase [Acidobacteriaceae bacterium]|nr:adenylate kinase [Acidobacteriaceae bacterium]
MVTFVSSADSLKAEGERMGVTPGPVLLLGAPGSGKGTQAKAMMAAWGIPQVSTGDLLRENKARGTALGLKASELMSQGKLVPDDLVNEMVAVRLAEPDCENGYILDGYPRTLGQAEWLDRRLEASAGSLPVIAVSIRVSYNQLLSRVTGRRICPTCQRIYNVYLQPPKVDTVCDVDGTPLIARPDDTEAVFEERMRVYEAKTTPVVEHYRARGRFVEIDGEQPVERVAEAIMAAVVLLRQSR